MKSFIKMYNYRLRDVSLAEQLARSDGTMEFWKVGNVKRRECLLEKGEIVEGK